MESDIFDIIEFALRKGGYSIADDANNANSIIIKHENSDTCYRITVTETEE